MTAKGTDVGETGDSTPAAYDGILNDLRTVIGGERDMIANAANAAALLLRSLGDVNWVGWYLLRGSELVLGPFQGGPARSRIPLGQGACGVCAEGLRPLIVPNVHDFPGHIACDSASRSEIVIPATCGERLIGVLDIDSPTVGRFSDTDALGLARVAALVLEMSDVEGSDV